MKHRLVTALGGFALYRRSARQYVVVGVTFRGNDSRVYVLPAIPQEDLPVGKIALPISDPALRYYGGRGMGKREAWAHYERLIAEADAFDQSYFGELLRGPAPGGLP